MSKAQNDKGKRRAGNIYDAVAGRLIQHGFHNPETSTAITNKHIVAPDEALFQQKKAPIRNLYDDVYDQHRFLKPDQKLPDSDLLKMIHAYTADFYARKTDDKGKMDEKSLDETALLAMGILLEEAAAHCLGQKGALALAEPE